MKCIIFNTNSLSFFPNVLSPIQLSRRCGNWRSWLVSLRYFLNYSFPQRPFKFCLEFQESVNLIKNSGSVLFFYLDDSNFVTWERERRPKKSNAIRFREVSYPVAWSRNNSPLSRTSLSFPASFVPLRFVHQFLSRTFESSNLVRIFIAPRAKRFSLRQS